MTVRAQPLLVNVRFEQADTSPLFKLGEVCRDSEGGEWIYGQADGAIALGAFCNVSNAGQVQEGTTATSDDNPTYIANPQVALTDNQYAWFWHGPGGGSGSGIYGKLAASITAGEALTTTATAGVAGAGGDTISGVTGVTTTTGAATVEIFANTFMRTN